MIWKQTTPHVNGLVESMAVNTIGVGFTAQSRIRGDQVQLASDRINELQKQMEWEWSVWSKEADVREKDHFNDLLLAADRSMLVRGEYLIIPQMVKRPHRTFGYSLCLVDPLRLQTPSDLMWSENIIDGIEVDNSGFPRAYWVRRGDAKPGDKSSKSFIRIAAYNVHRKQVFHGYITKDPEQWRGYVFFAPAMKYFRDLSDLHAKLNGNQAACEQVVALQNQVRGILTAGQEDREVILEDYRNDTLSQLSRLHELIDDAPVHMPDSHLFGISAAAQVLAVATKNYFDLRNLIAAERLAHPQFSLEV